MWQDVWGYLRALWRHWVVLVSGVGSVIVGAVSAYLKTTLPYRAFWAIALVCFIVASFQAWRDIRADLRLAQLEAQRLKDPKYPFKRIEEQMPDLLGEMRTDLSKNPLCREFILTKQKVVFGFPEKGIFVYYYEDHDELDGKLRILENHGLVRDIRFNQVPRFAMQEDFVQYLLGELKF
jgi:hypothetical protein